MVDLRELVKYCDDLLDVAAFRDYAPNGLQVEGKARVQCLVAGVTASQALLDAATQCRADVVLVHHGYFWKGEDPCLIGMKGNRVRQLMLSGMSLLAYHLPLDAHPEFGNNAQLGRRLGVTPEGRFGTGTQPALGWIGAMPEPMSAEAFVASVERVLERPVTHISGGPEQIRRIGWCTGAAQGFIHDAADAGVDLYLSGEISEPTAHVARERGLHYVAAGHHATERYGAAALGEHLAHRFDLKYSFIDVDNPA